MIAVKLKDNQCLVVLISQDSSIQLKYHRYKYSKAMKQQYDDFQDFDQVKPAPKAKAVVEVKSQTQIKTTPNYEHLYTVLDKGDMIIKKAHPKAIILVGLTRKGKSTTFNWMLNNSMIGFAKRQGEQAHYTNSVDNDKDSAIVGNSFASVTLAPNLFVDFISGKIGEKNQVIEQGVSLLDMAGYEDKRNYIGVIGVSYFLKEVFQKVKKAKFVIVISESMLDQTSGQGIIKTFRGFFNMFHYKQMTKQVRAQLRKAIVVVITKSKQVKGNHYERLKLMINKIKEQEFKLQNKPAFVEILSWLLKYERLQPFKAAVVNKHPQSCNFITEQQKNYMEPWGFFDLEKAEETMKKSPICLPFLKDFQTLDSQQVSKFEAVIEKRVKGFEGFAQIITLLLEEFNAIWNNFLDGYQTQPKTTLKFESLKRVFCKIKEYNQVHDLYKQNSLSECELRVTYKPITLMQSIKLILKIYEQADKITQTYSFGFEENMDFYDQEYPVIVDCLKGFVTNNQDYESLHVLKYILRRGFKEFKRLYQLKESSITDAKQKLKDYLFMVTQFQNKKQFIERIIKKMNAALLLKLFPTQGLIIQYEDFFDSYVYELNQSQDQLFWKQQKQSIETIKADLFLKGGDKIKALLCYIRMFLNLQEIANIICNSSSFSQYQKNQSLNKVSMKKIKIIRSIVRILKALPEKQSFSPIDEALRLCQHNKMMEDIRQIYQQLIDSPLTPHQKRLTLYLDYALYSAQWGDVDFAISLLKKRLKLQEEDFESYSATIQLIKKLNNDRVIFYKAFNSNLNTITRLPPTDQTLSSLLNQIQIWVQSD